MYTIVEALFYRCTGAELPLLDNMSALTSCGTPWDALGYYFSSALTVGALNGVVVHLYAPTAMPTASAGALIVIISHHICGAHIAYCSLYWLCLAACARNLAACTSSYG